MPYLHISIQNQILTTHNHKPYAKWLNNSYLFIQYNQRLFCLSVKNRAINYRHHEYPTHSDKINTLIPSPKVFPLITVNNFMSCHKFATLICQKMPFSTIRWQWWSTNPIFAFHTRKSGEIFGTLTGLWVKWPSLLSNLSIAARVYAYSTWLSRLYKRLWRPWQPCGIRIKSAIKRLKI